MKKIKIISLILFILFCILAFIFGIIYHDTTNNVLVDYDNKTNIINILSDKDFDTIKLKFTVVTKEFGDKEEKIEVNNIKANIKKEVMFENLYSNSDVTINEINYDGWENHFTNLFLLLPLFRCACLLFLVQFLHAFLLKNFSY